jgi:hypothetical protein
LSEKQCKQTLKNGNFNSTNSEGNCVGWVNVTQTLLANIRFDPKGNKNAPRTKQVIVDAFRYGTVGTIPGYRTLDELIAEAQKEWVDSDVITKSSWSKKPSRLHPVQEAVIELQNDQPNPIIPYVVSQLSAPSSDATLDLAQKLEKRIRYGMPAILSFRNKKSMAHAVMAVGLEAPSENEAAEKFYILDPNHPHILQTLELEDLGVADLESEKIWVYHAPDWRTRDYKKIEELRERTAALVKKIRAETRPARKAILENQLHSSISVLKTELGALHVNFLTEKEKSAHLLDAAFQPHIREQIKMTPEEVERLFKGLFRRRTDCKPSNTPLSSPSSTLVPHRNPSATPSRPVHAP